MTWLERMFHDPTLRVFVDAQRGHDAVELAAMKVELEHAQDVIQAQQRRIQELEPKTAKQRKKASETT